jgi:protoporphyrinogen oxidase
MEVIVVGAGLAGLHAAWRLERLGHDLTVLEARDRIGGPTWSHAMPDGTVVERGGESSAIRSSRPCTAGWPRRPLCGWTR